MFYLVCNNSKDRDELIIHLKSNGVHAVFHYLSLQQSEYYNKLRDKRNLPQCEMLSDHLVRLPFYFELSDDQVNDIITRIQDFYINQKNKIN